MLVLPDLKPCRNIHIHFDDAVAGGAYGFQLLEQEVLSVNRTTGRAQVAMRMPKEPPTQEYFDAWVEQSLNSSARQHFDGLCRDVTSSMRFGSQLLTRSAFAASVLQSSGYAAPDTIASATTSGVLNLNLAAFDDAPMQRLMEARSDVDAFRRFRRHLEKHFR